jgi:outer membrane protein assembly factor BamB
MARAFLVLVLALSACAPPPAQDTRPVPLLGLDPVLLIEGREVPGLPALAVAYGGYRYLFASAATRDRFAEEPERYAIQLDGECPRAQGGVRGDPARFAVVDRRIYLFHTETCRTKFVADPEAYLPADVDAPEARPSAEGPPLADNVRAARRVSSDWPQWGGPTRDFKSPVRGLAARWPRGGPRTLWRRPLGDGFSAIVVTDGTAYTMLRRGDQEVAIALDAGSGETRWEHAEPTPFIAAYKMEYGPGPHATPLCSGDLVITAGATGRVQALDRHTGEPRWTRDLIAEFGATPRPRGYSSSPLAYRDAVILMVGGHGAGVVALRQSDGSLLWKSLDLPNSQSSPILIDVDGQEQVVAFMAEAVVGLDPLSGRLLWRVDHATDWGLNVSTPVWGAGNLLFVSSAYGGGSRMIRLTRHAGQTTAEPLWFTRRVRLHFGNALRLGPYVLGSSGDFGPAFFVALDVRTGELAWRERGLGKASFVHADGRLIILDEDGDLTLATPSAEGLRIDSKVHVLEPVAWTAPSLAGTTLYLRDRREIVALDLR